jgi:hypothetical protein
MGKGTLIRALPVVVALAIAAAEALAQWPPWPP